MKKDENLNNMRHSLAHVLASAVVNLYPNVKLGTGPVTDNGFFYDFEFTENITERDLKKIEKEMRRLINQKQEFTGEAKTIDEALEIEKNQPFKQELINDLAEKGEAEVTFYTNGDFTDLCRGGHLENTSEIGAWKLDRIAGAYWKSKESNPQMQRIYGLAFETKEELDAYLARIEEAKKRDHRKLGKELDLFTFSDLIGAGLPLFTPRGTVLRDTLAEFSTSLREKAGFEKVWTPHITKKELYETSGHWAKFGDELFLVQSQVTGGQFALKPMNCPHHTQIFNAKPRTYRELPVRYMEVTTDYRDEQTGELGGLSRVRSLTQDDSHVFCRQDQIEGEIQNLVAIVKELYGTIGMTLRVRLSYRDDSDTYLGEQKLWENAQEKLKKVVLDAELDYFEEEGEAAFYGPKIDFMAMDAIGREHQVATVQLDFVQPERFGLTFVNQDGENEQPIMIHHATLGSIERFLSVFIEHTAGKFPVWCAPEQLRIIQVKTDDEKVNKFVAEIAQELKSKKIRFTIDNSLNSVGKKIRNCETLKIPYSIVLGDNEAASQKLPLRASAYLNDEGGEFSIAELIKKITIETQNRIK